MSIGTSIKQGGKSLNEIKICAITYKIQDLHPEYIKKFYNSKIRQKDNF